MLFNVYGTAIEWPISVGKLLTTVKKLLSHSVSLESCRQSEMYGLRLNFYSHQLFPRLSVEQGDRWSWKVLEFRKTIFQPWKVIENSKCHGKVMENKRSVMDRFCEIFTPCVMWSCWQLSVWFTYWLISVYLEKYVVLIGRDFHCCFGRGKSLLTESGEHVNAGCCWA